MWRIRRWMNMFTLTQIELKYTTRKHLNLHHSSVLMCGYINWFSNSRVTLVFSYFHDYFRWYCDSSKWCSVWDIRYSDHNNCGGATPVLGSDCFNSRSSVRAKPSMMNNTWIHVQPDSHFPLQVNTHLWLVNTKHYLFWLVETKHYSSLIGWHLIFSLSSSESSLWSVQHPEWQQSQDRSRHWRPCSGSL